MQITTYFYKILESGQAEWDRLWSSYKSEQNANELYSIRYGLACSKDETTIRNWLQLIKGDDIRTQDKHTAINQVSGTEVGRDLVWEFIENEWTWIKVICRFLAESKPLLGQLYNSAQSKDIIMISKVGSRIMIGLSSRTILRPNQTSRMSSTTPGLEMSDKENLDSWNQRFLIGSLYKTCS